MMGLGEFYRALSDGRSSSLFELIVFAIAAALADHDGRLGRGHLGRL
jgi:hypothetical protein